MLTINNSKKDIAFPSCANLEAFIKAQEKLGNEVKIEDYNDSIAVVSATNAKGNTKYYSFNYQKNVIDSTSNKNPFLSFSDYRVKKAYLTSDESKFEYDENNRLIKLDNDTGTYSINYDRNGNLISEVVNDKELFVNTFDENNHLIHSQFANNSYADYQYGNNGKVSKLFKNGELFSSYEYDSKGSPISYCEVKSGNTINFIYDINQRLVAKEDNLGYSVINHYGDKENIIGKEYSFDELSYRFELNNQTFTSNYFGSIIKRDISDRIKVHEMNLNSGFTNVRKYNYVVDEPYYEDLTEENHDSIIENKTTDNKLDSFENVLDFEKYSYDSTGNITTIHGNHRDEEFIYDSYDMLVDWKDSSNNRIIYKYDKHGNIIEKNGRKLVYDNKSGLDLCIIDNGFTNKYDENGNPLIYRGNTLKWENQHLIAFNNNEYRYNGSGIRTEKVVDGIKTHYFLDGSKVIFEKKDNEMPIGYFYENNEILGLTYKGFPYYYVKNSRSDVTAIIDERGNPVVQYEYDPWGKIIKLYGPLASTLGKDNPYRFRSYRYDEENGFYYLTSRYYDPENGRFISPDRLENLNYTIMSATESQNLYSYSKNNPVMSVDPSGNMSTLFLNGLKLMYSDVRILSDKYVGSACLTLNGGGIFTAFHETAQLVAAKQLSKKGYLTMLEYPIKNKSADIYACNGNNYLYEVKPITTLFSTAKNQLNGYLSSTGFSAGPSFPDYEIDFLPKIKMRTYYEAQGIVRYAFTKDKKKWFNRDVKEYISENDLQKGILFAYWIGVACAGAIIIATLAEDVLTGGAGVADDAASISVAGNVFRGCLQFAMLTV